MENTKYLTNVHLLTNDKLLRPDRIMFFENEAIVVDYKTGEKKSDKYNWQVKRYAKMLERNRVRKS